MKIYGALIQAVALEQGVEMYCTSCGAQQRPGGNFCQSCGRKFDVAVVENPTVPIGAPTIALAPEATPPLLQNPIKASAAIETVRPLGIKWLIYWAYIHLPLTGVIGIGIGLLLATQIAWLGVVVVAICAPYLAAAVGLYKRKLWGWRLNWLTVALNTVNGLVPNSYDTIGDPITPRVAGEFAVRLVFLSLVWILPNVIY